MLRPSGSRTSAYVSRPSSRTLTWPQLSPGRLWKYLRLKLPWLPPTLFAVSAIGIAGWLATLASWSSWPGDTHAVGQESEQTAQPRQVVPTLPSADTPTLKLDSPPREESAAAGREVTHPHVRNGDEIDAVTSSWRGELTLVNGDRERDAAALLSDSAGVLDDRMILVRAGQSATMTGIAPGTRR